MNYIEPFLTIIAILFFIPTSVLFIQVLSACIAKEKNLDLSEKEISIAVLIPAHNESSGIVETLNSIKPQLKSTDRLIVVADNCSDDTAKIVLENGVEVVERFDLNSRGKGFALDFGLRHLSKNPMEIVVIIDADCIVEENGLRRIASHALQHNRPVQALYLMHSKTSNLKSKIAEFAWCVRNLVRPLGYAKLGLPCQLMGTGMAFPWNMISNVNLANGNIVEDMKLGIDLCMAGTPPLFYSKSKVTSYFPLESETQSGQRTRWEHGHLAMIFSETPSLLFQGVRRGDKNLLAMALDLSVPPLALLVVLLFGFTTLTFITVNFYSVGYTAYQLAGTEVVLLTSAIIMAWIGWGRHIISFSSMLLIPVYIVLKIPHYVKFLFKRQKVWNKTERDKV
jgi:cellulose synthase/poly-beta-1,6-N-acetylglucosamine synthase-like glycosyltransferase